MRKKTLVPPLAILAAGAVLWLMSCALSGPAEQNAREAREALFAQLLPGGAPFEELPGEGMVSRAYRGTGGQVLETVTEGYVGPITLLVGVDNGGKVTGAVVWDMEETWGLGRAGMTDPSFLSQMVGMDRELALGENVDALTGATVTAKAIVRGVNAARAYVTGTDASSGATEWGG